MPSLRLPRFKAIGKWLDKTFPFPVAFFLKGWLYGFESLFIDAKVVAEVERAIAPVKPPEPTLIEPMKYTEPSDVEGLDIIGYSYKDKE